MTDKKMPWELDYTTWKSEEAFIRYVNAGLERGLWNKYQIKIEFIKTQKQKRMRNVDTGRIANHSQCNLCKKWYPAYAMEVDHKQAGKSLKSLDDIKDKIVRMLYVDPEHDLQYLCKPCHKIKSYADKFDISFEDAKLEKEAIAIEKSHPTAKAMKKWLLQHKATYVTPFKANRQTIKEILKNDGSN